MNARKKEIISSVYLSLLIRDYNLITECVEYCVKKHEDCSNLCTEDQTCKHECDVELSGCLNECPCQAGCPSGCECKSILELRFEVFFYSKTSENAQSTWLFLFSM